MTTAEFLEQFKANVEADIGDGELETSDLQHMKDIFTEMFDTAAKEATR